MKQLLSLVLLLPVLLVAQTPIANIQDSTSVYDGQQVTIEGVVTIGANTTNNLRLNAFIQDSSGKGMMLFDYSLTSAYETSIIRGNRLSVTGTVDEYNGVTELTNFTYTVLETGVSITPYIIPLSLVQADDTAEWEGTLCQVNGTLYEDPYVSGGGTNLNLEDTSGNEMTVRVWDSTGITIPSLAQGDELTAVGVVGIYNSNAQVLPGYQEDLIVEIVEVPVISNIAYTPTAPTADDPINVTATITDANGTIEEAMLEWRLASASSYTMVSMTENGTTYSGTIPARATDTDIVFCITALDDDNNSTTSATVTITSNQFTPIAEIQDNVNQYNGQTVEIQGVVTMGAGVLYSDRLSTYIQDSSGRGIMLYDYDLTSAYMNDIVRGNRLQVTGTVEEYNGTTEITDFTYTVVETGVDVDEVVVESSVAGIQTYAPWEGTCVKLTGAVSSISTAGTGANIVVVDDNIELTVRVWDSTGIDYSGVSVNDDLVVRGVVGSYYSAAQLVPGYQEDILNLDNPITDITWSPNPAFIGNDVTVSATIEYTSAISSATLSWALVSTSIFTDVTMTNPNNDAVFTGVIPAMADIDDDFLVRISAVTSGGQTIQSDIVTIPVYTGSPIFDTITISSAAMSNYNYVDFPFVDENVNIVATIRDLDGTVASATAYYGRAAWDQPDSTMAMTYAGNNKWTASLPPLTTFTNLDDDYIVRLNATDDLGHVTYTEETLVQIAPRCPIVTGIALTNAPNAGEALNVTLHIYDTDGTVDASTATLRYSLDYKDDVYSAPLTADSTDVSLFTGSIAGRSSGTTLHVNAEAEDYMGNAASEYPSWDENAVEYTYPVRTHTAILKIPATPFDPYHGETIPIDYYAQEGDKVILRIYSAEGKLVHTPDNSIVAAEDGLNRYEWDGRNRARRLLPLGIYICHLEVTSAEGGHKKTDRAPIVIGAPLN